MLFGKTLFDAKNYNDLKNKVKSLSGDKLIFPSNNPISEECKNLLVSLIEFNPEKRIEWNNFFNHELFKLHKKNNK